MGKEMRVTNGYKSPLGVIHYNHMNTKNNNNNSNNNTAILLLKLDSTSESSAWAC